ncbi:hypothetical protein GcC1_084033 [Golovinomyces cichoracearum]|uniref:Uncharacterized protein n=1 Tax=Golovinomyces cichoracearum TaxID=62708 RepID=A0A420IJ29_9PEZI|nr:hypothetical protein GcC1_084033 [Golovinomyces cichoracearum]
MASKDIDDNEIYSSTGATKINPTRIVNEDTPDVPATNEMGAWIDEQLKHYERMGHRDEILWDDL